MSAVGDYEYVKQDRLGSEGPILADVIAMYADKAIDELEAENERAWGERDRYLRKLQKRNAQLQRLKCCGNCCWYSSGLDDCHNDVNANLDECNPSDGCHFTPPRWSFDHVDRSARDDATEAEILGPVEAEDAVTASSC